MFRRIHPVALVVLALALAVPESAPAAPLSLEQPITFTDQRFEWDRQYSTRWHGEYGQVQVALTAGSAYEFFTHDNYGGTTSDPYLYVLDESGSTVLARNDDAGDGRNALIRYTPPETGTYTIRLRSYRRNRYGYCSVTLRGPSTGGGAPSGASDDAVLEDGDVLDGQAVAWQSGYGYRWSGAYGQYEVEMQAGTLYRFETTDTSGVNGDTVLYLFDDTFRGIWYDDDGGPGYQSTLLFRPRESGTYHLRLRAYNRGATGTCTLSVTTGSRSGETRLLPDLICWKDYLEGAYISTADGVRRLRFTNAVANRGSGPLQALIAQEADGIGQAYQVVYNSDGSRSCNGVGIYSFHRHDHYAHYHFEDFSEYSIRDPDSDDVLRRSEKVSFCLRDDTRYTDESLSNAASSARFGCDSQGISVGWVDIYGAELEGQELDLTGVANGEYDLVIVVNPFGKLIESTRSNNETRLRVEINGTSLQVID